MAKRFMFVLIAAIAISMLFVGVAFANFGPHGGFTEDTDACAACHRAHSSFSQAEFTDAQGGQRSGLLVSGAASITEFCLACHGDNTPGASTNVQSGIFDAGPSAPSTGSADTTFAPTGIYTPYLTDSTYLAALNGGAFGNGSTSTHQMQSTGLPMWGSYDGTPANGDPQNWGLFTCTDCHDPHGSSNYRILKDVVNGATVGGYIGSTPNPWVVSNEIGYPTGGWDKGAAGAAEMAVYEPSYTAEKFANSGAAKSMSNWCAGCHTAYVIRDDAALSLTYNYTDPALTDANPTGYVDPAGSMARHRHPVNIAVTAAMDFPASSPFSTQMLLDSRLPLEMPQGTDVNSGPLATDSHGNDILWDQYGIVGCLTCHFAHGTSAEMTGWANAALQDATGTPCFDPIAVPVQLSGYTTSSPWPDGVCGVSQVNAGVDPGFSSALLRANNRGVCERCHNK